ncbi:hypothetical protein ACFPRL_32945 [Pseudoclavibacter helvolus]
MATAPRIASRTLEAVPKSISATHAPIVPSLRLHLRLSGRASSSRVMVSKRVVVATVLDAGVLLVGVGMGEA